MRTLLVCGSRTFDDYPRLCRELDAYLAELDPSDIGTLIHGAASGADSLAAKWARVRRLDVVSYPADWATLGRGAGFKRNADMVALADYCVAFWDCESRGTAHTIALARAEGIPTLVVRFGDRRSANSPQREY